MKADPWLTFIAAALSACTSQPADEVADDPPEPADLADSESSGPPAEANLVELAEAFASADPEQMSMAVAQASLGARAVVSRISPDLLANDPEAVPVAIEEETSEASSSSALLGESQASINPKFQCNSTHGCPYTVSCPQLSNSVCVVTDCGSGSCSSACVPGLDNLVWRAWCSYGCMSGPTVTGSAFVLFSAPFNIQFGPYCLDMNGSVVW